MHHHDPTLIPGVPFKLVLGEQATRRQWSLLDCITITATTQVVSNRALYTHQNYVCRALVTERRFVPTGHGSERCLGQYRRRVPL